MKRISIGAEKSFLKALIKQRKKGRYFNSLDFGKIYLDDEIAHTNYLINSHPTKLHRKLK